MTAKIIRVDEKDNKMGLVDPFEAHTTKSALHRAITCFLYSKNGELLITKRAAGKLLWPGFWETSCSTHPVPGESYEACAERRIGEELGVKVKIKMVGKFVYQAPYKDIGSENEVCALLVGEVNEPLKLNPAEIVCCKFITKEDLAHELQSNSQEYAPWVAPALETLQAEESE